MIPSPPIDSRTREELAAKVRELAAVAVPRWNPGARDAGSALVEIYARYLEILLERLNRVPERNFLAFLEMIGVSLLPPMPARSPVQFFISGGAKEDAVVPEETPLATAGAAPQAFETERALRVTRSALSTLLVVDPAGDRYAEPLIVPGSGGRSSAPFEPFRGITLLDHLFTLGQSVLLGIGKPTNVHLQGELQQVSRTQVPLLGTLSLSALQGGTEKVLPVSARLAIPLAGKVTTGGVATTALGGLSTRFTREVRPGDLLVIDGTAVREVVSVTTDTALVLAASISIPVGGVFAARVESRTLTGAIHTAGVPSAALIGVGTLFNSELKVGDLLAIAGIGARRVEAIGSNLSVTVDQPVTIALPGLSAVRVRPLFLRGRVHTGGLSSPTLTGVGSAFITELAPGDTIGLPGGGDRTVLSVLSDTSLTLDQAVSIAGPPGVAAVRRSPAGVRGTVHTGGVSSTTLTGVGTLFLEELSNGEDLLIPGQGRRRITSIVGNTSLVLDLPVTLAGPPGVEVSKVFPGVLTMDLAAVPLIEPRPMPSGDPIPSVRFKTTLPLPPGTTPLPDLTSLNLRTGLASPIPAEKALANAQALDLTKGGIFPFGERAKINDALYLGSGEVFSRAGARITLGVDLSIPIHPTPDAVPAVTLTWEFWSGTAWIAFATSSNGSAGASILPYTGFSDGTQAFTLAGMARTIAFDCPPIKPVDVAGTMTRWIRARITSGNYGEDAKLTPKIPSPASLADWDYKPPTFRPPFATDLQLSYLYDTDRKPERLVAFNSFQSQEILVRPDGTFDPFRPFDRPGETDPALYLGFAGPIANAPATLYLPVVEQKDLPASPLVTWEYRAGTGWKNLGAQDETKNLSEPGLLQFLGPVDLAETTVWGRTKRWLRARLVQGDPALFRLEGVYPNTVWARQSVTLRGETLGSSTGKPFQAFTLSKTPILAGQVIEVREPEPPPPEELRRLEEQDGEDSPVRIVPESGRRSREVWVRWHAVEQFHFSGPSDRHYILDRRTGRLEFGDGIRGMIPPPGRDGIAALRYYAGGGRAGNVPAGSITVLKRAIPLIDRVNNPFPAGGGADQESMEAVRVRGPLTLKHRDRAVSYEDYEWLAREASSQVARVRCIGAFNAATAGKVRVLIVPASDDPEPFPAPGLLRQVRRHLDDRRIPTADLLLEGPAYVRISVTAEVVPRSFDNSDLVRRQVLDRLAFFLHPLKGGPDGDGWDFGRDVYASEISASLEEIEGVDHVDRVGVTGLAGADDRTRDGGTRVEIRKAEGELASTGTHTVSLVPL